MIESSDPLWSLIALGTGVAIVALFYIWKRKLDQQRARLLGRQTAQSSGKVLGLRPTQQSLGEQPVIIRVTFALGGGAQLSERELETIVSPFDAHRVQLGAEFPVRFEPADPDNFSVDFGGLTGVVLGRRSAPAEP